MPTLRQRTVSQIWQNAKKHYTSSKAGLPGDMQKYQLCECCDQPIIKQPISMWEHTKQFQVFGFGYPLFYSFLKYCIVLVLVLIASRTGSQIYMATKENYQFCYGHNNIQAISGHHSQQKHHYYGNHHENALRMRTHFNGQQGHHPSPSTIGEQNSSKHHNNPAQHPSSSSEHHPSTQSTAHEQHHAQCTSFMVYLSIFQGEQTYNNYFLRILSFVIHLVALIGIRNNMEKQEQYYDQRTCSLSDYSVIVSNLPQVYGVKQMVLNLFQKQFNKTYKQSSSSKNTSQIKQVIYIFQSKRLKALQKQKNKLQKHRLSAIDNNNQQQADKIQRQIKQSQREIQQRLQKLQQDIRYDQIKCDKVIVIMNTEGDKGEVLESFQKGVQKGRDYSEYFNASNDSHHHNNQNKKTKILIKQAPQPNEINWKHIDQSDTARSALILRGWLFTILFLAVVTIAFYFIMLAKTNLFVGAIQLQHHNPNDQHARQNKIFATIIVFVALFGVILFNKFIMGKVLHKFVHMQRHAYTDKQGHSFAMKYSLGMFFTTALMTLAVEAITFKNFYSHQYGVIEQQTIMFFVTAFFIPLVWLIHPYNLSKKFDLWMNQNKLVRQQKANQLIEDFPYDLGKRYAEIFQIMWFTFLYSELIPLGSFLVLIGLFLYYWVDKYNFLRRSALKGGVSGKMSLLSLKSLDATLFLAPAGRVLFSYVMHNEADYLAIVLTILGILYLLVPISDIIWAMNGEKFLLQQKTYDQAKHSFKQHYYTLHPVYRQTHRQQIKKFRKHVSDYYRQEFKKHRLFGAGRGNFTEDDNEVMRRESSGRY